MRMPASTPVTTIDELLALPHDGLRHELLDGTHVVTPAPSYPHQVVLLRLLQVIAEMVKDARVQVLLSPADIRLDPRTLVQPDLFIVKDEDGSLDKTWADVGVPLLAAEILSPSTAARDRGIKRKLYLEAGVEEYWIVDLNARLIERWRERAEIHNEQMPWRLDIGVKGIVNVNDLFVGMREEERGAI